MSRVSIQDLYVAADWLEQYEEENEDSGNENVCKRVAQMLIKMAEARTLDAAAREVAKRSGAPLSKAKAALRKTAREEVES